MQLYQVVGKTRLLKRYNTMSNLSGHRYTYTQQKRSLSAKFLRQTLENQKALEETSMKT